MYHSAPKQIKDLNMEPDKLNWKEEKVGNILELIGIHWRKLSEQNTISTGSNNTNY